MPTSPSTGGVYGPSSSTNSQIAGVGGSPGAISINVGTGVGAGTGGGDGNNISATAGAGENGQDFLSILHILKSALLFDVYYNHLHEIIPH